jgi:glucose/arabinose dehydrogenase/PKD repeat protein
MSRDSGVHGDPANRLHKSRGRAMATCFSARRATWMVSLASVLFGIGCGTKEQPARAAAPLDSPALLAGYGFSEGAGNTTADASPNAFGGTLVGSPGWVAGKNGTGLSFNGSSTYVDLGNPSALQFSGSMTLSAWVLETANVGDDGQIVAKSDGISGWQLKSSPDTGVRTFAVVVTDASGNPVQRYSSTVRALNTWYHVAGIFNATARTLDIYVNGALDNGVLSGTVPSAIRASPVNVNIGRRTGDFHIQGIVDDVRIYARALAPTEIVADMGSPVGTGGGTADTTPPNVSVTAPTNGATVSGSVAVNATATDNVGVAGVQFLLDGASLGAEDTTAPYSVTWNTTTASPGTHVLSARARDAAGNTQTSSTVSVTVNNTVDTQPPTGTIVINGNAAATNSRTATLTLSATDTQGAVTQMRFSNTGSSFSTAEGYATTKTWTLTNGAGTKTVYVQFRDAAGNWSGSFTDSIVLDTTAPTISSVAASGITGSSANVTWTTSEPSTSRVEYGLTTAFGSFTPLDSTLVSSHAVTVSGLSPATTYRYRVRSIDAAGNERVGNNNTFTTAAGADIVPPSTPTGLAAVAASPMQVNLSWNAATDNVGVTGYIVFRNGVQVGTPAGTSFSDTGLSRATSYSYTVAARDAAGNLSAQSTPPVAITTPAFAISAVRAETITSTSAIILWTTDQLTTSQVQYGTTTSYGTVTPLDAALTTSHSVNLSGLSANTTYHYRVISRDAAANSIASGDNVFTTLSGGTSGTFQNEILIGSGLNLPTAIKFLPNGEMLVLELGGRIRRVNTATWTIYPTNFLTLTNIGTQNGQQGLMDLVLDPNFATNRFYYVFYTLGSPNRDRASRFTATADLTGTIAGSEFVIYQDPDTADIEHHGGALNFGNDGKLYITTGEHFNPNLAQSLTSSRGKLLRFNSDGTIPTDNPFHDGAGPNVDSIWALGLRNPFRASIDPPTGRLYIGDVGGNVNSTAQEELHVGARGANFGWPICEGFSCGSNPTFTSPIYAYAHNGRDSAITGGFVYRGTQFPSQYRGSYFFADYAQNWIKRLTFDANGNVTGVFNFEPPDGTPDGPYGDIVYLCEGPDGALYYVDLGYSDTTGEVGISKVRRIRFVGAANQPPVAVATAQPTGGPPPLLVTFSSAGTSDPEGAPLSYLWTFGDGATSTAPSPVHTYAASGRYTAQLSVSDGVNTTLAAPISLNVGNRPTPTILAPGNASLFRAGNVIAFSGTATDAEDGTLPASAFSWSIDFLHGGHVHPALPQNGVTSGTFTIPLEGHDFSGDTRYRFTLTVTDSDGLQGSTSVLVFPDKVNLTFDTVPSGLDITLDGIPRPTPFVHDTLIGFHHTIIASNQTVGQAVYAFASWSDGAAQQHVITVPTSAQSYVATYTVQQNPLPGGLVAGYRFSEGAGITTADLSGNGITGTLTNGPGWTTGQYGGGLSFTGDDFINLGNPAQLQMTGSMTLTAWIRTSSNPVDDASIVSKCGDVGWQLKTTADTGSRTLGLQISGTGGEAVQRYGATVLTTGTWYHVAGVYDASARTLSVYLNGALNNGVLAGTIPASQGNSPLNANIGQRAGSPVIFNFLGVIDEVHVFNRALSAAEIVTDMTIPR